MDVSLAQSLIDLPRLYLPQSRAQMDTTPDSSLTRRDLPAFRRTQHSTPKAKSRLYQMTRLGISNATYSSRLIPIMFLAKILFFNIHQSQSVSCIGNS